MALFTKDIEGIVIEDTDEPIKYNIDISEPFKGRSKNRKP